MPGASHGVQHSACPLGHRGIAVGTAEKCIRTLTLFHFASTTSDCFFSFFRLAASAPAVPSIAKIDTSSLSSKLQEEIEMELESGHFIK